MSHPSGLSSPATPAPRGWAFSAWCVAAAFGAYFCMYAFRKPFTAGAFPEPLVWGIKFKDFLVIAQTLGYALAKVLGVKVVAETEPRHRVARLLALIAAAEAALLLFAATPAPYSALWMFVNGVCLGMVFGLVLGFLEGREHTEALAAGFCTSFIVADGVTRSVGAALNARVPEAWMPAAAGGLFAAPLLLFAWMLSRIPPPSDHDVAARSERTPMDADQRWAYFRQHALGLSLLLLVYLLITVLRGVRGDFSREIWAGLTGEKTAPEVYAWTETLVAAGVLLLNGSTVFIRDNRTAFFTGLSLAAAGALLMIAALLGLRAGLPTFAFMVLHGLGLYLPYIAVHVTIFERLIAMTRGRANVGYLMYLADAVGYIGLVAVLLARNLLAPAEGFSDFFLWLSWLIALASLILLVPCWRAFAALRPDGRP